MSITFSLQSSQVSNELSDIDPPKVLSGVQQNVEQLLAWCIKRQDKGNLSTCIPSRPQVCGGCICRSSGCK